MAIKPVSGEIKSQDINDNLSYLDSKTNNISKGAPAGTYATVALLTAAYPNGNTNIYVITTTGNWHYWNGSVWEIGGKYQETGIADGAITAQKLAKQYNYRKLINADDFNNVTDSGLYLATSTNNNMPIAATVFLMVETAGSRCKQEVTTLNVPYYTYKRASNDGVTFGEWSDGVPTKSINRLKLSDSYDANGAVTNADFDVLTVSGTYVTTGGTNTPIDFGNSSGLLTVKRNGNWIHQELRSLQNPKYLRVRYMTSSGSLIGEWENPSEASGGLLAGKKIVNFGDSIFGNTQNTTSVSSQIADITGATVHNCGFGGCRMGYHNGGRGWDIFSMYRIADEIVKDDADETKWAYQNEWIDNPLWTDKPSYFSASFQRLKDIDFNTIDIITISYGTNDYTGGNPIDNDSDKYDTATFGGALRYSLNKIFKKYPHLKIMVCTPTYRLWFVDGNIESDSDTRDYAGTGILIDYVNEVKSIGEEYKMRVSDNYFTLGANRHNWQGFFDAPDGTHHNAKGRRRLAELISSQLLLI